MNNPFRLGDWQVDPGLNRITGENEPIQIEPKMMDLLVFLAHRAGQVVTKQELSDGDLISIGSAVLKFRITAVDAVTETASIQLTCSEGAPPPPPSRPPRASFSGRRRTPYRATGWPPGSLLPEVS